MFMLVGVNKQMEELTLILCKQALHQKGILHHKMPERHFYQAWNRQLLYTTIENNPIC